MQDVQTIYQQTVLPLPDDEKLRLATIILQNLSAETEKSASALDFLENLSTEKVFSDAEAAEQHLKQERESWDS